MDTKSENMKYILGIGNPIIDISATTDKETLKKFNLDFGGTVFCNDTNKGVYEELEKSPDVSYVPGGSVTNSIRVANWCLRGNQNYRCMLLGCVGNDEYGKKLKSELDKVDVVSILETHPMYKTSRCGAAIFKKERCLIPQIMASGHLSDQFVNQSKAHFNQVEIFFIEGYFVIEKHAVVIDLIKFFDEKKTTKIGFTLSATFMVEFHYEKMKEIADCADIIFCNEDEAEVFARLKSKDPEVNSMAIHRLLKPRENRIIVITCGKEPVLISRFDYTNQQFEFVIKQYVPLVPSEEIVDTNGCGDSFVGGFLSQYIQGKSLTTCARAGNYAASIIIKNIGCTFPIVCDNEFI
jgi:adenosine kinase